MSARKNVVIEDDKMLPTAVAPQKRGKAKRTSANDKPSETKKSAEGSVKDAKKADNAVEGAPKKRGRPVKNTAAEAGEKAVKTSEPKAKAAPKEAAKPEAAKKRGRPKKEAEAVKEAADAAPKKSKTKKSLQNDADRTPDISSKTPQVMKLVQQNNDMVNPTIMAGKSSIPRKLRGLEPLTKIMKREAEEIFGTDEEAETFNVTALVIDENAAEILRRFNGCDCEICVEQLSRLTAEKVPARFAKLKRRAVERNSPEVEELKAPLRRSVTSQMIRLVITNKKRSYHDK